MLKMSEYCRYAETILDEGIRDIRRKGVYIDWRGVEYSSFREFANDVLNQVLMHKDHPDIEQDCTTLDIIDILRIRK